MTDINELRRRYGSGKSAPEATPQPPAATYDLEALRKRYATSAQPKTVPPPKKIEVDPNQPLFPSYPANLPPDVIAGIEQGVFDPALGIAKGLNWVNEKVPTLGAIDRAVGIDPAKSVEGLQKRQDAYEASPSSKSLPAGIGRAVGQSVLTLPVSLAAGLGLRAAGKLVGPAAERVANFATGAGGSLSQGAAGAGANTINALMLGQDPIEAAKTGGVLGTGLSLATRMPSAALGFARGVNKLRHPAAAGDIADEVLTQQLGGPRPIVVNQLIPGARPTLADVTQHPKIAELYRTARNTPEYNPAFVEAEEARQAAREAFLGQLTGTPQDIAAAMASRDQISNRLPGVWANSGQANPMPVISEIDRTLAGPKGGRTAVKSTLGKLRGQFATKTDDGGDFYYTDPEYLYESGRKEISDMLDTRLGPNSDRSALQASRELMGVRKELDDSIEAAAPDFKQYLADYADASKPIDAMKYLQEAKLHNTRGNITLSNVQNVIRSIEKARRAPGANEAKSISDQQLNDLYALRDDLLSQEASVNKGRAVGSNTVQNALSDYMFNNLFPGSSGALLRAGSPSVVGGLVGSGAGALLGHTLLPIASPYGMGAGYSAGALLGARLASKYQNVVDSRAQEIKNALIERILDPTLYTPRLAPSAAPAIPALTGAGTAAAVPLIAPP